MNTFNNAFVGARVADALSMPVHWYYNTAALDRDYSGLSGYCEPRGEHADSILWRSRYVPLNEDADILHGQAKYWGKRGIHYHQSLAAGENTLNFKLAEELYRCILLAGGYSEDAWLERYVVCMRTPGWHGDTYVEEVHRSFFENRARGIPLSKCGIADMHIGGLAPVPALVAALQATNQYDASWISKHVALTHNHPDTLAAADALACMLCHIAEGATLREAILLHATGWIGSRKLEKWSALPDRTIIGRIYSPACYLPESFTASLALAWKYHDDFDGGILANARCGGDSCHRGAVVGALLGSVNPIAEKWISGLKISSDKQR